MDGFFEILGFAFMQRALAAGLLVALMSGLLGTFVVQRRLSFLGDGLAHAAFGGMGIGALAVVTFGVLDAGGGWLRHPLWVALPFALLTALGIAYVRDRTDLSSDTAIGVFFAVSVALGVLAFSRIPPDVNLGFNVMDLLFGSILAVRATELTAIAVAAVVVVATLGSVWGRLAYATFDDELARTDGVRARRLEYLLFVLAAIVVAVSAVVVGIVLMAAYLVIPAAAARLWSRSLAGMSARAVAIGMTTTLVGVVASFYLDAPTGSAIILTQAAVFVAAVVLRRR
ncbi:MAG: metal ABC transporter permease [Trueperaceae bacterium]|nr:metal ABC transporter permease [Trueperaceae bacterium]